MGVPVIAARTPGISTYFDDTEVEFFSPGDVDELSKSIRHLYSDSARRTELIQNSDEFNQRYNWARVSNEYVDLVDRLGSHSH
jgi:glycosyltransferase involved in cell wall biosynthesis